MNRELIVRILRDLQYHGIMTTHDFNYLMDTFDAMKRDIDRLTHENERLKNTIIELNRKVKK